MPAVFVSNVADGPEGNGGLRADFENTIIDGNQGIEFLLQDDAESPFEFSFSNSLLRFEDPGGVFAGDPLYDFNNDNLYRNNVYNGNPDFLEAESNDLRIGGDSEAIGIGNILVARDVPFDLLGLSRIDEPDAGAYQHIVTEE